LLGIKTGLRQSELLNLQWPQVDLFKRTLTILEQKNKGKDTLPLNAKAMEVLKERAKVRNLRSNYVFYNANRNRINARNLLRAFYSAVKKAKLVNLRWHDATRHTFATRLVQGGADIYSVQKLGRWRHISMVMRYAHHYPESLRAGIEILDRQRSEQCTISSQFNEKGVTAETATP
jgi:integrase